MPTTDSLATAPATAGLSKAAARDVHRSWKLARALQLLERLQWAGPGQGCPVCKGREKKKKRGAEAEAEAVDAPADGEGHAPGCTVNALLTDRVWQY